AGLKLAVGPLGTPAALRPTVSAVPLTTAVLIVEVPLDPVCTDSELGLALIEKSFAGAVLQFGNLKVPTRVFQLKVPLLGMYSVVYQKVKSSAGSTVMVL